MEKWRTGNTCRLTKTFNHEMHWTSRLWGTSSISLSHSMLGWGACLRDAGANQALAYIDERRVCAIITL